MVAGIGRRGRGDVPSYANWVWGGGFLAQGGLNWGLGHGAVDFAGSGVVHAMGEVIGLDGPEMGAMGYPDFELARGAKSIG